MTSCAMRRMCKRLLILVILLITCATASTALAQQLTLRPSSEEVRVYASRSMKANIVGYIIVGGSQEVEVIEHDAQWCYVRFTSVYGDTYGWIPASAFQQIPVPAMPPATEPSAPTDAVAWVSNDQPGYRLNLRLSPSNASTSLGKYYTGTPLLLCGESNGNYVKVAIGSVEGWMDQTFMTTESSSFLPEMPMVLAHHPGGGVNLRVGPGEDYARVGWYPHGTPITVMGVRADDWYHVMIGDVTGYVSASLLSDNFPWQYGSDSDHPANTTGQQLGANQVYVCTSHADSMLHLRRGASASSESLGRFYTGTPAEVITMTRTGWAYVRIGQLEGYMDASWLTTAKPIQTGVKHTVANTHGAGLNLRLRPTTASDVLVLCPNHSVVTVLGKLAGDWFYVQYGTDIGYMIGSRLLPR